MKGFTTEEFREHLKEKAPQWELVGEYKNALTRTEFKHKLCGNTTLKTPYIVTSKPNSCRFCNAKKLAATDSFMEKMERKTDYELLSEYKNNREKVHIRHKVCGKDFWTNPYNFSKAKDGCPFCKGDAISRAVSWTHDDFLEAVGDRLGEYEFLDKYVDAHTPIRMEHSCGNVFECSPNSFLRGSRCKACKYSTGEGQVYKFIKRELPNDDVVQGNRTILGGKELDIVIPKYNLAFEYDGLLYHSVYGLSRSHPKWDELQCRKYHKWKTDECHKKGIRLVHIFEDEWLEKREIVEDKIRAILKLPMDRMFARKLEIKEVERKEAERFLDQNHIQGKTNLSVAVGLYNGDDLVALQAFLPYTRSTQGRENRWELVRYATKLGTQVIGGFSKCLKYFEREYPVREIVSFADKRWCDQSANVYESSGFTQDKEIPPDYWYVFPPHRYHKSAFRKSRFKAKYPKVYSPDKTEAQMADEVGLKRIYDCGKIRYVKTL